MLRSRALVVALTLLLATPLAGAPRPAAADGAASTRNIILGGAVVGAGTLIWLNHNKKVHEKYAEYDRRQAATEAQANEAEGAYQSEVQAYDHESALVGEYQKTISYQHAQVEARDREIASLTHSLVVAKARSGAPRGGTAPGVLPASGAVASRVHRIVPPANVVSYGWGTF